MYAKGKLLTVFVGLFDEGLAVPDGSFIRAGEERLVRKMELFNKTQDFRNLKEVIDVMGDVQEFKYEDPNDIHNVTTFSAGTCAGCNTYTIEYDDQDRVLRETYANGGLYGLCLH